MYQYPTQRKLPVRRHIRMWEEVPKCAGINESINQHFFDFAAVSSVLEFLRVKLQSHCRLKLCSVTYIHIIENGLPTVTNENTVVNLLRTPPFLAPHGNLRTAVLQWKEKEEGK